MTSDFKLTGSGSGVADEVGVALAASSATGPATRGFFLQELKARQIQSTAPNKRIDRRFDNIRSRFFALGQRIPVQTAGHAPDEKVASALSIATIYSIKSTRCASAFDC